MRETGIIMMLLLAGIPARAGRVTVSLDGEWQIEDSVSAEAMPARFTHTVPVPGLANLARPAFADVDRFDSTAVILNRISKGKLPASARPEGAGVSHQRRNYFWYRKEFRVPERRAVAILKINKAQFGTSVWVNGKPAGEHLGCFTAGYFNITGLVRWGSENTLTVRIGAHPGVLPRKIPAGDDFEKNRWTPGIYDSVSLLLMDNPVIETIQVAPRIQGSEILVQTKVRNYGAADSSFEVRHVVKTWKGGRQVAATRPRAVNLTAGEEKTLIEEIPIPRARLWSPEDPFLYVLETATNGDSVSTRFGMREFRFDTATRRAYLNGKVYFLRGSNITLHRFFEDPDCGHLPWEESWVRKLLVEIPKKMHWNAFRFCIGPVPEKWMEIADEAGLLIQNEFFIWTGAPDWHDGWTRPFDADVLIRQYTEWMRDNWNHPSLAVWDANNETLNPIFAEKVIPAVRDLDLSHRPWENSYNLPAGPDDPVEDHPYLFIRNQMGKGDFHMEMLERMNSTGRALHTPSGHAVVLNEYGWLWLNRDGSPTELTGKVYRKLLGDGASADERRWWNAYLLGGLTEFWRAHRNYAGVLHFVYLTSSYPGAYTSDHFRNVKTLELDPYFADYVGQAFQPVGVYINFWRKKLKANAEHEFIVMVVNDERKRVNGTLTLSLETGDGSKLVESRQVLELAPLGQRTYRFSLKVPQAGGEFELRAVARHANGESTLSRRKVRLE